ncbi:hypothetical protein VUR80DRAFT_2393 [Thermomyces stellatus]
MSFPSRASTWDEDFWTLANDFGPYPLELEVLGTLQGGPRHPLPRPAQWKDYVGLGDPLQFDNDLMNPQHGGGTKFRCGAPTLSPC